MARTTLNPPAHIHDQNQLCLGEGAFNLRNADLYEALSKLIQNCGYAIVRTLYRINSDTLKSGRVKLYEIHSLTQNKLKQFVQLKEQKPFMLLYQGKKKL